MILAKFPVPLIALFLANGLNAGTLNQPAGAALPQQGQTMQTVQRIFGAPQTRRAPAGGDAPRHPPITRWDYPGFAVFFEHQQVIDTVVPDRPTPVVHAEQLRAADRQPLSRN